ncbi:hypothetical protein [Pseudomonas sp. K2]|uniref:hypothetical protein n=1 Tax=Pseudomonas sp. K2 TaxID=212119 RepID=UPI0018695655|nr:hypothetical protein [Pseudomonas sp. K2]
MPLTLDTPRAYEIGDINDLSVAAGVQIFEGSAGCIVAITDIGKPVYASDSGTFLLTAAGNSLIGHVHRFVRTGVGIVKFTAQAVPVAA